MIEGFCQHNVYQMADINGGPGFWVTRTTWGDSVAHVVGIGMMTRPGPYFGSPPVLMDIYSRDGKLRKGLERLSKAGTYKTWRLIDTPNWVANILIRRLDDMEIAPALARFAIRRSKKSDLEEFNRVLLVVPFEQKEKAKALGAKWDAARKKWWIKAEDEAALAKARKLGFMLN